MRWAISASDNSVRRRKRNSRIFARMDFSAEGLTAGINLQNNELSREFRARRGRKTVSEKVKLDVRILAFALSVLAVDDPGLRRMHFEMALCQACLKRCFNALSLMLDPAVN